MSNLSAMVARDDLLRAVTAVTSLAVPGRTPVPVLSGVHLSVVDGVMAVRGFDYEVEAIASLAVKGGSGSAVLAARHLIEMLRVLPKGSGLTLSVRDGRMHLDTADVSYRLTMFKEEDYPGAIAEDFTAWFAATEEHLAGIARVAVAAGRDDTLPVLTHISLDTLDGTVTAACTDRYRLAAYDTGITSEVGLVAMLPAKTVTRAVRLFKGDKHIVFERNRKGQEPLVALTSGNLRVTMRSYVGEFPKWRSLIPSEGATTLTAERAALALGIQQAAVVAERGTPIVLSMPKGKGLLVEGGKDAVDMPYSRVDVEASIEGDAVTVGLNPAYARQAVEQFTTDKVRMTVVSPFRPVLFRDDHSDAFRMIVMPVRLSEHA